MQPTGIVGHNGAYTKTGYANDVVAQEAARSVALSMKQIGCPGETPESVLAGTDHCPKIGGQLAAATTYLSAHAAEPVLVTIDLGFNNVRACLTTPIANVACAKKGIATVARDLPRLLAILKARAGSQVRFVGLTYEDAFLGDYVHAGSGAAQATASLVVMDELNQVLSKDYRAEDMAVANVPRVFASQDTALVKLAGGRVPQNVANACRWTWYCTAPPWGPDDHPNNTGYRMIAKAIVTALGTWRG
jgi:hypothetical protein